MNSNPPTRPNQRCRVIGSQQLTNGGSESPNLNRIVRTVMLHPLRAGKPENSYAVWRCHTTDGRPLITAFGAGEQCDFLAVWLEVIDDEPEAPAKGAHHIETTPDFYA